MGEKLYNVIFDYHTHTTFSHGKGSIEENVIEAVKKGLRQIAISDHGPGHLTYGIKRSDIPLMREKVEELNSRYDDIEIFLSVEANIINYGNYLDISKDDFKDYDFIVAGYHYGVKHGYCIKNYLNEHLGLSISKRKLKMMNTDMTIRALYENNIKILAHPGDKAPIDMKEIAQACEENGTWMEISQRHKNLTVEDIKICEKYDVKFVLSSDAHRAEDVGCFERALKRVEESGIDISRIVNIEKI